MQKGQSALSALQKQSETEHVQILLSDTGGRQGIPCRRGVLDVSMRWQQADDTKPCHVVAETDYVVDVHLQLIHTAIAGPQRFKTTVFGVSDPAFPADLYILVRPSNVTRLRILSPQHHVP